MALVRSRQSTPRATQSCVLKGHPRTDVDREPQDYPARLPARTARASRRRKSRSPRRRSRSKILENREAQVRLMVQKFKPDFVITGRGISGPFLHHPCSRTLPLSALFLRRLRPTLSLKSERLRPPPGPQNGQHARAYIRHDNRQLRSRSCSRPTSAPSMHRPPDGTSKDTLDEIDNLAVAIPVARNSFLDPNLAPEGGATEVAISIGLHPRTRKV
ncbi:hypothetical protein LXA43DRAFT_1032203, partial [Ganoderma leucocontextum]